MKLLFQLIDDYLADARAQLDELNRKFVDQAPFSARPFFEEVVGAFSASLDVLQITREEMVRLTPTHEFSPTGAASWEVITVTDAEGRIEYESEGIAEELGFTAPERIGRSAWEWIHPEDLQEVKRVFAAGLRGGGRTTRFDLRIRHRDGSWRRIRTIAHAIRRGELAVGYVARSEFLD